VANFFQAATMSIVAHRAPPAGRLSPGTSAHRTGRHRMTVSANADTATGTCG